MFIYILIFNGPVAHWLERTPDKREVGGSSTQAHHYIYVATLSSIVIIVH